MAWNMKRMYALAAPEAAASRARYSIWQGNARSNSVAPSRTTTMNPPVITMRDAIVCTHEDRHLSPTGC
jgi:hypothetical protein